jgi:hypothetical protein
LKVASSRKSQDDGWGGLPETKAAGNDPSNMIALDDNEFGKY